MAQMVLDVRKNFKPSQFHMLKNIVSTALPRNQALGASLFSAYSWLSVALGLAQMVLDVLKNFKPAQFYMLNNICFNNFAQNSSPGVILALGLLLAVYGPGLGPYGPGGPEKP